MILTKEELLKPSAAVMWPVNVLSATVTSAQPEVKIPSPKPTAITVLFRNWFRWITTPVTAANPSKFR